VHAGGGPKVLLAFAPPAVQRAVLEGPLPGFTPTSITDPAALAHALDDIRRKGWTLSIAELDDAAFSVAAPVRDYSGDVIAALTVTGPMSRLNAARELSHRQALLAAASGLSADLGYSAVARHAG
jgi:IclR family KDG regulon transcriptional repressor